MAIDDLRREYLLTKLHRSDLADNPIEQFQLWLQQAIEFDLNDPTAMVLSTVDKDHCPSQRIVLLKDVSDKGFVFYTNSQSNKAQQITENPNVSLHFPWHKMDRQISIKGTAEKLGIKETLAYFTKRPRESQIAAWASQQSRPIKSRDLLIQQFEKMKARFAKGEVPLPDFWSGYRVKPLSIEFWQGGAHRLHDRFVYTKNETGWTIERLMP
ncbi:pyridoxamine 5'-phosphate oxidase [Kangiella profundi]|uniref:Pyridoxine/pyridoxamine 5'-phosphate oxidase n=1 Tax=Kangiella profundi TaxID=1561924 RepID=A0A2K9ANF8_9GAMM|nr:pyridoxamine 5'-phosphate oxidase [Kangiella profundi]AUD79152.1 pyridoxamine 5'-phosphate oxidase [Kangiella profundi]GGF01028.1 pyridoxine/pyridoxamine 5'-phosphate oxidase [Kangiella profundi]